jgi:hypothetical protein
MPKNGSANSVVIRDVRGHYLKGSPGFSASQLRLSNSLKSVSFASGILTPQSLLSQHVIDD